MALVTYHLESVVSEFNIQDSLQILSKKKDSLSDRIWTWRNLLLLKENSLSRPQSDHSSQCVQSYAVEKEIEYFLCRWSKI